MAAEALAKSVSRTTGDVFLSYSRTEFHFTESLARRLQEYGVNVWFDVSRLAPGSDWEAGVTAGLDGSGAVVLVASQASLSSPHVEAELRRARAAGKPVHVVLAEAVDVPTELGAASVHDLRSWFEQRTRELAETIRGLRPPGAIASARRFRFPFVVWWILVTLFLTAALLVALGVWLASSLATSEAPTVLRESARAKLALASGTVLWAALTATAFRLLWSFARRRFRLIPLVFWLVVGWTAVGFVLFPFEDLSDDVLYEEHGSSVGPPWFMGSSPGLRDWFDGAAVLLFLIGLGAAYAMRSSGVFRWLPTGEAHEGFRERHGFVPQVRVAAPKGQPLRGTTYRVHHGAVEDAAVAADVSRAMRKGGHVPADDDDSAEHHVVVVSSDTSRDWLETRLGTLGGVVVCLFATSVLVPADATALRRRQWMDYRSRSRATLQALSAFMHGRATQAGAGLNLLPERIERPVVSGFVLVVVLAAVLLAGLNLGVVLGYAVIERSLPGLVVIRLAAGCLLLWIADGLIRRRLTRSQFILAAGVVAAALWYLGGTPMFVFLGSAWSEFDPWSSLAVPAVALVLSWPTLWRWLPPKRTRPADRGETFVAPTASRVWLAYTGVIALLAATIAVTPTV